LVVCNKLNVNRAGNGTVKNLKFDGPISDAVNVDHLEHHNGYA